MTEPIRFCRSRNGGRRCTRPLAHAGLHRHRTIMWSDAGADAPECPGSGTSGTVAPTLPSGFPDGRALCTTCLEFVRLDEEGRLTAHETSGAPSESVERAEWFNTFGWTGPASGV